MSSSFSKKRTWTIGLATLLIVGVGIFVWARQDTQERTHVIGSADGTATLTFSKSALPIGVSLKDISIVPMKSEEYPEEIKKLNPLIAYRMEPDGTEFIEPIAFSITFDAGNAKYLPLLMHVSGNTSTPIQNVQIKRQEGKKIVMTGTIQHFSLIFGVQGFIGMEMPESLGRYPVGTSFTAPVTFNVTDRIDASDGGAYWQLTGRPQFEESGLFLASDILDPKEVRKPNKETKLKPGAQTIEQNFTCVEPGFGTIVYTAPIFYDYEFYVTGLWRPLNILAGINPDYAGAYGIVDSTRVECYKIPDATVQELMGLLTFDADTFCDGRVEINGRLKHEKITELEFELKNGGQIVSQTFDPTSGDFHVSVQVPPGQTYRIKITATTKSGDKIFVSDPGFTVPLCPDYTPKTPKGTDGVKNPPPKTGDPVLIPLPDPSGSIPLTLPPLIDTGVTIPLSPIGDTNPKNDTDTPDNASTPPAPTKPLDICCLDPKANIGERYYIPFDGSGCLPGHEQVPLDKNCANPLLY